MGRFPQSGGGGSGTIEELTSIGHTVTITDPTGPITNLESVAGGGTVTDITSPGGTVDIGNGGGPIVTLAVGSVATQTIAGTTGSATLYECQTAAGTVYSVLAFNGYTNVAPETITFDAPYQFQDGAVGLPSWGTSPALALSPTEIDIPIIAVALTGAFVVLGI